MDVFFGFLFKTKLFLGFDLGLTLGFFGFLDLGLVLGFFGSLGFSFNHKSTNVRKKIWNFLVEIFLSNTSMVST